MSTVETTNTTTNTTAPSSSAARDEEEEDYSVVLNEGFFDLNDGDNTEGENVSVEEAEDRIVRRLDRLIQASYEKEVTFVVKDIAFSPRIAAATIRVFQYYSQTTIDQQQQHQQQWDELVFDSCRQNESFLAVLKEALQCRLFRKIHIERPAGALPTTIMADQDTSSTTSSNDDNDDDDSASTGSQPRECQKFLLAETTAIVLRDAMASGSIGRTDKLQGMQTLILQEVVLNETCLSELGRGLVASNSCLSRLELRGVRLLFLHEQQESSTPASSAALDGFLSGLFQNTSLKGLWITDTKNTLPDMQLARLVSALPLGLKRLYLDRTAWHDHTLRALGTRLSDPDCRWTDLSLGSRTQDDDVISHHGKPSLSYLLHGMSKNRTLELLYLEDCGLDNDEFQLIMMGVSRSCTRLLELDLSDNQIWSLDMSKSFAFWKKEAQQGQQYQHPKTRLQSLDVSGNPILEYWHSGSGWKDEIAKNNNHQEQEHLIRLLEAFPGLGRLDEDIAETSLYSPYIEHLLDINGSGRRLLLCNHPQDENVPLSLWTLVLARAVEKLRDDTGRQVNVMYHLLQGPAFACRGSYD
jgi:hypothetical protein